MPYDPELKERVRRVLLDNPHEPGSRGFMALGIEQGTESVSAESLPQAEPAVMAVGAEGVPEQPRQQEVAWGDPGKEEVERTSPGRTETEHASPVDSGARQHIRLSSVATEGGIPEGTDYISLINLRLRAIRTVQDLYPKQVCAAQRVRELSQSLAETSGESVHYRSILARLQEAHGEWLDLEERLWSANDAVRSTQWLVDLLAEPLRPVRKETERAGVR